MSPAPSSSSSPSSSSTSSSQSAQPTAPTFSSLFQSGYQNPSNIVPQSDDPNNTSNSPYFNELSGSSAGAISAAVISAFAFVLFVAAGYMLYSRRRKARTPPSASGLTNLRSTSPPGGVHTGHKPNNGVSRVETSGNGNPPPPYTRAPVPGTATVAVAGDNVESIERVELPTLHRDQEQEPRPPVYSSV